MSTTIDERVVSMQFDNRNFEKNVQTTMSTLDKLKQKLNLPGAAKGLEAVDTAAKKLDLSVLSNAAEKVGAKFSALEIMGVTALVNITNSAVNAGKRIISALTIDPVKTGFSEYETQINAVQTILANTSSKGTTIDQVNEALDTLNTYADKTIYNFTEMTRNIGTFTAAGIDLDKSVSSIQGIANLAAVSGSTSQQASTAMYQMSQALSSGALKLQDWNSVVNAGMGGQVFQDALKRTATVMGTNVDAMIESAGSFRESLKSGWITADVLTETLNQFTMAAEEGTDQWNEYKESLKEKGYTEEQAVEILKMANTATDAATKVKTFTQLWDTLQESVQSGWTQSWEIIVGDFEEAKELLTNVSNVLGDMINESSNARVEMLQGWKDLGGRTVLIEALGNAFKGIMAAIKPISEAFREIFPPTTSEQLYALTEGLKNFTSKLVIGSETADKVKRTFKGLFALLDIGVQIISASVGGFIDIAKYIAPAGDGLLSFTAGIGDSIVKFDEFLKSSGAFTKFIEKIVAVYKGAIDIIKGVTKEVGDAFSEMTDKVETRFAPLTAFGNGIKAFFVGVGRAIQKVAPIFYSIAEKVGEAFKGVQKSISGAIQSADYNSIFDILNGGVFTAIGVFIAKFIKSGQGLLDNAGGFIEGLNDILGGVGDAVNSFSESIKAKTLKTIATAIAILAASLLVLSLIDSSKLAGSLGAITILFTELSASLAVFGKISDKGGFKNIGKVSRAMISLSAAVLILSAAMKIVSTMTLNELGVALLGVAGGLTALVVAVNFLPENNVKKAAKSLIKMSTALVVLAAAMKIMASMDLKEIGVALLGVVSGLGAMVIAIKLLPKNTALKTAGIFGLATAMVVLASAMKIMASMNYDELTRSLTALIVSLGATVIAINLLPKSSLLKAAGLTGLATAMVILSGALKIMGSMSWNEIGKGLTLLAGSLTAIVIAMNLMKTALPGAAALLVVATSLAILTPVLMGLGRMKMTEIGKSLLVLAGAFVVIGVAGAVLGPLVPAILGLSAAISLLGVGLALTGAGIVMIAAGITALAAAFTASGASIVVVVSSLIGLIPFVIEQIGVGIVALCNVISGSAAAICKAVTVIIVSIVDALITAVPRIVDGALLLVSSILTSLVKYTPTIVKGLYEFLISLMDHLAEDLPDFIKSGVKFLMAFFKGVIDALKSIDIKVLLQGIGAVGILSLMMSSLAAAAAFVPGAMVGVLGIGLVIAEIALVLAAIGGLAQIPGLKWLVGEGGELLRLIGVAIGNFIGGLIGGVMGGVTSQFPQIGADLSAFMENIQPFVLGAKNIDESVVSGVKALASTIMTLTAANILEGLTSWFTGGSSLAKFGDEIAEFGPKLKSFADSVAGIDVNAVSAAASAAKILSEMTETIPNEGGLAGWFAGENSLAAFGEEIAAFGPHLKTFADSVAGIDGQAVVGAAEAATALCTLADKVPNEGGVAGWFAGENSIASFGEEIAAFGPHLKEFADSVSGLDVSAVTAASEAGVALAEMADKIPNEGGVASWFAGDNALVKFGKDIASFGPNLKTFADSVGGINPSAVMAASEAATHLAEMTDKIPNEGGVVSWFAGENSLAKFGTDIAAFGPNLKKFADSVAGIDPDAVLAASTAGMNLAAMADKIPNEGGVTGWFVGETSLASFGEKIASFGVHLKSFSNNVTGIDGAAIIAASEAGKNLAEMADKVPNEGGVKAWFAGESSLAAFGEEIASFGANLKEYSIAVEGMNVEAVTASATAATALCTLADNVPNEGGVEAWFAGENSIAKFGDQLVSFGLNFMKYAIYMERVDTSIVETSTAAAESIVNLAKTIPEDKLFKNETTLDEFGAQLSEFGSYYSDYYGSVKGVNTSKIYSINYSIESVLDVIDKLTSVKTGELKTFGTNLATFGSKFEAYYNDVKSTNTGKLSSVISTTNSLINMTKRMESVDSNSVKTFSSALTSLGKAGIDGFIKAFADSKSRVTKAMSDMVTNAVTSIKNKKSEFESAGKALMDEFKKGIESKKSTASKAITKIVSDVSSDIKTSTNYDKWYKAGGYLVDGFANGISANTFKAKAKSKAMAEAALEAAKDVLGIHSPATEGIYLGEMFDEGVIVGAMALASEVESTFKDVGSSAIKGMDEGLNDKMTAEEKADKRAQNITAAYQKAFDKIDLDDTTLDLEYSVYGGDKQNVSAEKYARQLARISLAQSKYDTMKEQFGEDADVTQKAYNELLQENIDLDAILIERQTDIAEDRAKNYENSINWIDKQREAGELSLFDELAAWKRVQSQHAEGTEERIAADKEVIRVQNEITDATEDYYKEVDQIHENSLKTRKELSKEYHKKIEDLEIQLKNDIKSAWDNYNKEVESRANSLYSSFGLFDKVDPLESVDGSTLITNLESQVNAMDDWRKDMSALSKRGISKDLISELQQMGPDAAAQIKALNSLSGKELKQYEKLWKQKHSLAREQATLELSGLKNDTLATIHTLRRDSDYQLDLYRAEWGTQISQLDADTTTQLATAKSKWLETLKVDDPDKKEVTSSFTDLVNDITTKIGTDTGWSEAGGNMIDGIVQGVVLNAGTLTTTVSTVMTNALMAAKAALGINSPSKEFEELGMYSDKGFARGLLGFANVVTNAAKDVGNEAISGLSSSIAKIRDIIDGDIDVQPTIRPVLDLTNVRSGANKLNALFSRSQAMSIDSRMNKSRMDDINNGEASTSSNGDSYSFVQNNYSPKALSRTEIYRQTKNQFSAMKGMVKT